MLLYALMPLTNSTALSQLIVVLHEGAPTVIHLYRYELVPVTDLITGFASFI